MGNCHALLIKAARIRNQGLGPRDYGNSRPLRCGIPLQLFLSGTDSTMTDPDQNGSRRPAITGLAIAVVLLAVGLWLAHELTASSKMQDCLMSGRTNCNVIPAQ
jgi:hypothetical protein